MSYAHIVERFGSPKQIVSSYISEMETSELLNQMRIRKKMVQIFSIVALFVLALWAGAVTSALIRHTKADNGYIIERIENVEEISQK